MLLMSVTSSVSLPVIETPDTPSPCTGCHAGCCRGSALPLTGRDIFRIVTELRVPFSRFVRRWADPSCVLARGIAPHFFFDDDRQTPYVIGLRHTESRMFPGTRKCVFLEESPADGNASRPTGRCSIYERRPVGCRVFPSRLDEAGAWGTRAPPEPADERLHEAYRLCSRTWSVFDFDLEGALNDLRACRSEMELFHAIAHCWNAQPGPWPFFPDFLELIYTALAAA
jgi:Fe-S-cluster containining protein